MGYFPPLLKALMHDLLLGSLYCLLNLIPLGGYGQALVVVGHVAGV